MALSFNKMKKAIDIVIKSGHVPSVVGLQGIGKTDMIREYAKEHDYPFAEITCSLIQEGDLAMPYVQKDSNGVGDVNYSVNRIITNICEKSYGKERGILFLDEFNRTSSQVLSELMNLVHQRRVVDYKLADNVVIILAMNPSADMVGFEDTSYSVSFADKAITGRIVTMEMQPLVSDWLDYGSRIVNGRQKIHPMVHSFIGSNSTYFYTAEVEGKINSTPRGWSRVSDIIYTCEELGIDDMEIIKEMVKGTVEADSADAFVRYYKNNRSGLDFYSVARGVLNANSQGEWEMDKLCKMNDAELSKMFDIMLEAADATNGAHVRNIKDFFVIASPELAYAFYQVLATKYDNLYAKLLENDDFSQCVLKLVVNIKNTEVGGFASKPD